MGYTYIYDDDVHMMLLALFDKDLYKLVKCIANLIIVLSLLYPLFVISPPEVAPLR